MHNILLSRDWVIALNGGGAPNKLHVMYGGGGGGREALFAIKNALANLRGEAQTTAMRIADRGPGTTDRGPGSPNDAVVRTKF